MSDQHLDLSGSEIASAHAWLLALARGLVVDQAKAEDLVQDAWVSLARRGLATVRDWRGFLGGVVRIRAQRERVDTRARATRELRAARTEDLPSADLLAERLELARAVVEELARLPLEQRTLLQLRYQEGLEPSVIARRRGIPAGTLRSQLARARDALRERLDARTHGRREAWAALAALPLARESVPFSIGALAGGLAMSAALKLAVGLGVAAAIGWWVWPPAVSIDPLIPVVASPGEEAAREPSAPPAEPNDALATDARVAVVEAPGAQTHQPKVPRGNEGDVVLRVLDSVTEETLPDYAVAIRVGDKDELVTTGADGTVSLASSWFAAPFDLIAVDDPDDWINNTQRMSISPEDRPPEGAVLLFEVLAGPTYRLRFDAPPPLDAELVACVTKGAEPASGPYSFGRVRPGNPPWSRLDPSEANPAQLGEGPWTLTVHDRNGYWLAWGAVQQIEGVQREHVLLQSAERGALTVTVTVESHPLDCQVSLQVNQLVDGQPQANGERHEILYPANQPGFRSSGGRATVGLLEPGLYRVWVGSASLHHREDVEIRAGETAHLAIDLTNDPGFSPLTVYLRSQTGRTPLSGVWIFATRQDGKQHRAGAHWVQDHPDGSSEYRFDELEAGAWEIGLSDAAQLPPFEPQRVIATAGGEPVEFLCLDERAAARVQRVVRLVDAITREPIPFAGVTTYVDGMRHYSHSTEADGTATLGPYLADADVFVCVRAEDHRPLFTRISFEEETAPVLDLTLEQGWGTLIDVVEPGTADPRGVPVAGVRVLLDGVLAGTTDERGQLLVESDHRPTKIELQREGYRLFYGDIDPETLAPSDQGLFPYFVVMERNP